MLSLLAGSVIVLFCVLAFDTPPQAFLLLVPTGLATFILSLIIGHFLSEPLRLLVRNTSAFCSGADVSFVSDGRLLEADELANNFQVIAQTAKIQEHDLRLKERRQAQFISDVAHELRTPLTAIRGNAEMLADPELPPGLHHKFVNIVITESERLSNLTNDLLTLHKLEDIDHPMTLSRVNLNTIAHEVADVLEPLMSERQAHVTIVGEAPDVLGDSERLKQVIINLLDNASRFIEPGGHIAIELFGLRGNSVLAVKDDGSGFGDIDPKLLFDRFYRTDASRSRGTGGTGLGLAIVKGVVEAHDGTVEAFNLPEGGACFIVAIPSISDPVR